MSKNYSFFHDELALTEICRYRQSEGQKIGQEIGFATAAYEWIKKYGEDWKQSRLSSCAPVSNVL